MKPCITKATEGYQVQLHAANYSVGGKLFGILPEA